ncbi:hypothetical protein PCANC_03355 [Puccinia coronata f. sp. avenae]|uniref:Uncharacterized protein n=1 Tax=Puccinia coronata f. sp. avenae TaxID=200324 RepID=A0A2N5T8Q3_9BASI|nr:hypothetical protein PCANC_03355 [Puccinia coronata f. sp. avenae]
MILQMFMPIINARNAAYDEELEEPPARRRRRDSDRQRRSAHAREAQQPPAQAQPAAPATQRPPVPPLDPLRNPILLDGRVHLPKLLFISKAGKEKTLQDLRASVLSVPTAHPSGPRHPRVFTLIGQNDSKLLAHRGSPRRPPQGVLNRRLSTLPLPTPAPIAQVGPSRQERPQRRTDPYAQSRHNRARRT